jgi:hypothetical protein
VATSSGIAFVAIANGVATLLGTLTMPQPPLDALMHDGKLLVGGITSVSVVTPPCPPQP